MNSNFQDDRGAGSSNTSMAQLVVALANAAAMGEYSGRQPLETVLQHCESLVGVESKAVKSLRQMYAGQLSAEAQR